MSDFLTPNQYFRLTRDRPRKRFGQHFLAQPATAERIVRSADLSGADVAVEIGPGLGALTQFILPAAARLHLIEVDKDMAGHLETVLPGDGRAFLYRQDVMAFDFADLSRREGQRLVVLGNLPYNISSPLFFRLLESFPAIGRGVFMVQKEVGERLAASPGGKEYGVLSVLLGIYGSVRPVFAVGPSQFYPPPKVESLVIRVDFAESAPADAPPFSFLRGLVSAAFQQRRKTLQNSLKGFHGRAAQELADVFAALRIDPKRRPETLSAQEFLALGKALHSRIL